MQIKTSKTKLVLRSPVKGSHLELSPPDRKAMNFTKRDVKIGDAKDSGQKTIIPSFSGASHKTAVDPQQSFAKHSSTFLIDNRVKLIRSLPNNFCHEWLSARTHDVNKCLRFDIDGVVETAPKELNTSCPENVKSRHQLQTPNQTPFASLKENKSP